jgi:hypothetical protein
VTRLRNMMLEELQRRNYSLRARHGLMSVQCTNWLATSANHPTGSAASTCGSSRLICFESES